MEHWPNLLSNDVELSTLTGRLLILLFVISLEHILLINASYHPGSLWKFIAIKLARKSKLRPPKQQQISGMLGTITLLTFSLIITYAILSFATSPWFFEAIFLLLVIKSTPLIKNCKTIYIQLNKGKKSLAREQLSDVCIRDTQSLSTMGVIKSCIEGTIQQFSLHYFIPIIVYLVGGAYFLVFYGLTISLAQYWNPKTKYYRFFGKAVNAIKDIITLPFHCLLAVLIAVLFGFKHLSLKRNSWHRFGTGALLATTARAMNRELGGAVIYDDIKKRRPKIGTTIKPTLNDLKDLSRLIKRLRQSIVLLIAMFTLTTLLLP